MSFFGLNQFTHSYDVGLQTDTGLFEMVLSQKGWETL